MDEKMIENLDRVYLDLCTRFLTHTDGMTEEEVGVSPQTEVTPNLKIPTALATALANTSIRTSREGGIQRMFDALCSQLIVLGMRELMDEMIGKAISRIKDTSDKECGICRKCAPELYEDKE